jgi:CRISPR system Cascade subunit CasA
MQASFNLIKEPHISVLPLNTSEASINQEASLKNLADTLRYAHTFKPICHPLPTVEFGLNRLLVAIVLDIFFLEPGRRRNVTGLSALLKAGQFDIEQVDAYFKKYADRFDLFSETHPFLQDVSAGGEDKPVANLLPSLPSGTNVNHFHHAHEDDFALTPAEAACILTTVAPFMTAGGAGLAPSINGAPPLYVLVQGESLFETICRNLCAIPIVGARDPETEWDAPAWRWDQFKRTIGGDRQNAGYAESLTWMPRRIKLNPGPTPDHLIRTMKFTAGDSTRIATTWRDPNAAYRTDDAKGTTIIRTREGKEIWRDMGPIALLRETQKGGPSDRKWKYDRPRVLDQIEELPDKEKEVRLAVYAMRTDLKMKVFEWQREELFVPGKVILHDAFAVEAQKSMEQAEQAAHAFGNAVKVAYPRGANGNPKGFDGSIDYAERQYWHNLREAFREMLDDFNALALEDIAGRTPIRAEWARRVQSEAWAAFTLAIGDYDTNAHALERQTRARRLLGSILAKIFNLEPAASATGKGRSASGKTPAAPTTVQPALNL